MPRFSKNRRSDSSRAMPETVPEDSLFDQDGGAELHSDDDDSELWGSEATSADEHHHHERNDKEEANIAKAETKAVKSLKLLVYLVLIMCAIAVALAVYFYTSNSEKAQFQSSFQLSSVKVMDSVGKSIYRTLGALDILTTHIVSHARATNQTWPFILYPDFSIRAEKVRSMSDAVQFSMQVLVDPNQRMDWEEFAWANQGWINQSMKVQVTDPNYFGQIRFDHKLVSTIHTDLSDIPYNETRLMAPSWYNTPVETQTRSGGFNWDLLGQTNPDSILEAISSAKPVIAEAYMLPNMSNPEEVEEYEAWKEWFGNIIHPDDDPGEPASDIHWPIVDRSLDSMEVTPGSKTNVVGTILVEFFWRDMIKDILPKGNNGTVLVFHNPCYLINGPEAIYLGRGDLHDPRFDHMAVSSSLLDLEAFSISRSKYTGLPLNEEYCQFTFVAYPSAAMEDRFVSSNPIYFTVGAILIFAFTSSIFLLYDYTVERRQRKVMSTAVRTNAIVSSLFPSVVRDRIYPTADSTNHPTSLKVTTSKSMLKSFLNEGSPNAVDASTGDGTSPLTGGAPIAELFPDCTVMFADIVGFTAWSSIRDPAQVFTLLETLYSAFDEIARKRGVFKVETIGDSYVSVCGLPEPREGHAVVMCRFARDCRRTMNEKVRKLEVTLGPDTGDLKLRFGLNSGPVTAGVLRGERSRFQLFGDTVNCAARMESNGAPNMIQCSQKTADLLIAANKHHWIEKRADLVEAKGKGMLQTYWVEPPTSRSRTDDNESAHFSESMTDIDAAHVLESEDFASAARLERLIDWNVDAFSGLLKRIVARRMTMENDKQSSSLARSPFPSNLNAMKDLAKPRSEVVEVIMLPDFEFSMKASSSVDFPAIELTTAVLWQLRDLISVIAYCYRPNPFHNFEHASHVAMSIMKLLQRVMTQDVSLGDHCKNEREVAEELASNLHVSSFGITSDPLTQFAIVFAALVHDLDHGGVSNGQLVDEKDPIALTYDNQSPAEQHSVSMAWELLMRSNYEDLRSCLFSSQKELKRFRQLLVNSVIATDIFDPELKKQREEKWAKAFSGEDGSEVTSVGFNRKATIIIEHLIQASDVAHTMQHWHIYRKWNARLFQEMYAAFKAGRAKTNPGDGWYKGELWFFDNYIIPLAKKLKECRVFGVSSAEFLDYAMDNRSEWESKGSEIVQQLIQEAEAKFGSPESVIRRAQGRRRSNDGGASRRRSNDSGGSRRRSNDSGGGGGDCASDRGRPDPPPKLVPPEGPKLVPPEGPFDEPRGDGHFCINGDSSFLGDGSHDVLDLIEMGASGEWPARAPQPKPALLPRSTPSPPESPVSISRARDRTAVIPTGSTNKLDDGARFL